MQSTARTVGVAPRCANPSQVLFTHDGFTVELCRTPESLHTAFALRYRAYRNANAIPANMHGLTKDTYDEQANTRTHLIWYEGQPVASVRSSIWSSTYDHLPTEALTAFRSEVAEHIGLEKNILESCRYVTDPGLKGRLSLKAQLLLFRVQDLSSQYDNCETIITAVRARHTPFYERMLGFRRISDAIRLDWIDADIVLLETGQAESRAIVESKGMPSCTAPEVERYSRILNTKS